jgi:hypothetical protein
MVRRAIQRAIQATRPPVPLRTFHAERLPDSPPQAAISTGQSLDAAVRGLRINVQRPVLLIPGWQPSERVGPRVTDVAVRSIAASVPVTLGVPSDLSAAELRRWTRLAESAGAGLVVLGTSGWARVSLGERSSILDEVDLPDELFRDTEVVAVSTPTVAGSVGLWTTFAHPNTALRAKVVQYGAIELAAAIDARYLLIGKVDAVWLAAIASPAIVAEVLARGIERLRERGSGLEATGPWEDAGVQHLAGLVPTGQDPYGLVLRARLEDNADSSLAARLSELLNWPLASMNEAEGHAGDAR